jgi:hypothetical protein
MRGAQVNTTSHGERTCWHLYGTDPEGDNKATMHAAMRAAKPGDTIRLHSQTDGMVLYVADFINRRTILIHSTSIWEFIVLVGLAEFFKQNTNHCTILVDTGDIYREGEKEQGALLLRDYLQLLKQYEFARGLLTNARGNPNAE